MTHRASVGTTIFLFSLLGCAGPDREYSNGEGNNGVGGSAGRSGSSSQIVKDGNSGSSGGAHSDSRSNASGGAHSDNGSFSRGGSPSSESSGGSGGAGLSAGGSSGEPRSSVGGESAVGGSSSTGATAISDVTPPEVFMVSPGNRTTGVKADDKITITFSEPMDTASVAAALTVAPIPASDLSLSWSSDNRVLTVSPKNGFAYATGTAPTTVVAQAYAIGVSVGAKDVAGNALANALGSSFTTLCRIRQTLLPTRVAGGDTYGAGFSGSAPTTCLNSQNGMIVGRFHGTVSGDYKGFVSFSSSSMANLSDVASIESVVFGSTQSTPSANFYSSASVVLERMDYESLTSVSVLSTARERLGTLCSSHILNPRLDVTSSFSAEFNAKRSDVLFRLSPSSAPDNEHAYFTCDGFSLEVTYLAQQ